MTEKFIINQNGEIEDTMAHITFDSFMEILIVLNGQSRHLKKLSEENEQLKQELKLFKKFVYSFKDYIDLQNWKQKYEDEELE